MMNLFAKMSKFKKSVGIYQHPDMLIIHAQRQAKAGFCISSEPVFKLKSGCSMQEVGSVLRQALTCFVSGVPDPEDWKNYRNDFLKATGFKSWRSLESPPAKSCWVNEEGDGILFTPLRNGGTKGNTKGFQPFGANTLSISSSASDENLGRKLLETLNLCK